MTVRQMTAQERGAAEREHLGKLNINLPYAAQLCGLVENTVSGQWEPLDNETLEAVAGAARILLRDALPSLEQVELLLMDLKRDCGSTVEVEAGLNLCRSSRRKEAGDGTDRT